MSEFSVVDVAEGDRHINHGKLFYKKVNRHIVVALHTVWQTQAHQYLCAD